MEDQFDLKKFLIENKLTNLSLREEDNDWDIEVGEEWNVQELGVNDYITPEMFQDNKYGNEFKALNQDFKIVRFKVNNTTLPNGDINTIYYFDIEYKDRFGKTQQQNYQVKSFNKYFLKPQYKVVPPDGLNEQEDDEWDLEVGENWNIKELSVGDYITQEMLNDTLFTKAWRASNQDFKIVRFKKDPFSGEDLFVVEYIDNNGKPRQSDIDIESFNKYFLKPQYKIVSLDNLNEVDDEWDIATDAFDVQELTVGDKITPNMWDKKAVIDAGEEDEFLNDEIWTINEIRNGWGIDMTSNGGGSIGWNIDDVQALLKPQYKIVAP
jgi:hypothetical protein